MRLTYLTALPKVRLIHPRDYVLLTFREAEFIIIRNTGTDRSPLTVFFPVISPPLFPLFHFPLEEKISASCYCRYCQSTSLSQLTVDKQAHTSFLMHMIYRTMLSDMKGKYILTSLVQDIAELHYIPQIILFPF